MCVLILGVVMMICMVLLLSVHILAFSLLLVSMRKEIQRGVLAFVWGHTGWERGKETQACLAIASQTALYAFCIIIHKRPWRPPNPVHIILRWPSPSPSAICRALVTTAFRSSDTGIEHPNDISIVDKTAVWDLGSLTSTSASDMRIMSWLRFPVLSTD